MTKQEVKMILALIDAYSVDKRTEREKQENIEYDGCKEIPYSRLKGLKRAIQDIFYSEEK